MRQELKPKSLAIVTFLAGVAVLAAAGALVLTQAPPRLERVSAPGVKAIGPTGAKMIGETQASPGFCQTGEVLPAGTSAIRLSIWGFFGARVHLAAYEGARLLTTGSRAPNWTSDSVTVPVRPLARSHADVKLCFAIGPNSEPVLMLGPSGLKTKHPLLVEEGKATLASVARGRDVQAVPARMTIEYLAPGRGSWWSRLLTVARHMGLGRAYSGTWIALLVALMTAAVGVLAVRGAIGELHE